MAYKISVYIVLFFLAFNAGHVMLDTTGTYDYMGVETNPGDASSLEQATSDMKSYQPGKGTGSTLFGLYNAIAGVIEGLFDTIFPGFAMLKHAGVPHEIVNYLSAVLAIIPGYDLAKFLRSG